MSQIFSVENDVITQLMQEKTTVFIFLRHGIKLTGVLSGSDETTVLLKSVVEQMVYKDSISTIVPAC